MSVARFAFPFLLMFTAQTAHARDWPETAGWVIFEGDDYCGAQMEYEGKGATTLTVSFSVDGGVVVLLTNSGWSAVKDRPYEITWVLNGYEYSGRSLGIGEKYASQKGFGSKFGSDFIADFVKSSSLHVYRGDTLIDQLSLEGSGAATSISLKCLQSIKNRLDEQERERRRFSHIPDDPFADGQRAQEITESVTTVPIPLTIFSVGTLSDYPSQAIREAREGTIAYSLDVSAQGKVISCSVKMSSGHADLDTEACAVLSRRSQFLPSKRGGTYQGKFEWRLPK